MNATEARTFAASNVCSHCEGTLYVKLTRAADGTLLRDAYCPTCDRASGLDLTRIAGRRAALAAQRDAG